MLDIVIICVGKIDKQYWKSAYQEYYQRLQNNAKVKVHIIDEINLDKNINVNLKLESEKINDLLFKYTDYQSFLLDLTGQLISSEELAEMIIKNQNYYQGKLLFIIGGSNGVSQELKNNQKIKKLAFGRITLLHQLAQVILLEQLYRALQIINHKPYHK
ncbi:23S rRNA (pseudouridine(1915)-N(3))-methyltransferase RlmH [Spiroplasma platyhelix]|uniref:Ribosomal RNA large subunit methyltransferase H n=1 Tax=Spiroplasma platyhelix PALS-1 TaxID=1276218 RepID=A0A846U124_9MOLU|nr:23S rRNA (pseudouridine(1915)-N(3))-methyltransferase RlmH [Spiroplasma platyhelix]MBE4704145.1 Ribosomal RNA large subunit methyltransferase H [Spiroplasma platyhelix PALS-1]NKE38516.1 23S rRNA (pseudouridine(1915)-N(3))-methyltransferase RlmH [Spiroplasma platyhelix PALS-1]UJB29403.1 23S rRNA (pseudouridine1915-N3)-methyltransferase [Spiroplasma platyhelix PALS-1]